MANLAEVQVEAAKFDSQAKQWGFETVLDREQIEETGKADLTVALRGLNGVATTQTNASSNSGLLLRGASGGVGMVTLDGVPLFNAFAGFFPLSHFPLDLLDSVDVRQGFAGQTMASRTLGGSIQLTSRKLAANNRFLHSEGGSYGTLRNHLGAGFHNQLGDWTIAAGRTDIFEGVSQAGPQNGGNERDNFQMTNGLLNWNKEFSQGVLESSVYFVRTHDQYDGPGLLPGRKIGWKDDPNGLVNNETWVAQTHGSYQISKHWETDLRIGFTQDRATGQIGNIIGRRFSMDLTNQLWLAHWENKHRFELNRSETNLNLTWGVDAQQQHADSSQNPYNIDSGGHTVASPLVRLEWNQGDWLASSEMRLDHYDLYGSHTVFDIGAGWRLHPDMLLWAKGGTGYRAPGVNERLHPLFGSPDLQPEHSKGGEIGWRWQTSRQTLLSLSGYFQAYDNLIVLQQSAATGVIKTSNYPEAEVWGAELQMRHAWNDYWRSGLNYSFLNAQNPKNHLSLAVRPEHQGLFWTEWQVAEPVKFRIDLTFRDGYWTDPLNTQRIDPAPRLNAQIDYQASKKVRLYVRGENINDEREPDLVGFNFVGAAVYTGINIQM